MATAPEQVNEDPQAEVEEKGKEVDEQFAAADAGADPNADPPAPPTVEEVAASIGWTPKDKFTGPEDKWKPADKFIIDGRKAERNMKRSLEEMRSTLDTLSKTSGQIMEDKLREQADALAKRYESAVEAGDTKAAAEALRGHDRVLAKAEGKEPTARPAPSSETEAWASKNSRVLKDPLAAQRAVQLCEPYAKANYSAADQLAAIDPIMRREFPHLYDDKAPASVEAPRTRSFTQQARGKTAADMPKELREYAEDLKDRGLIKDVEDVARNYFARQAKG